MARYVEFNLGGQVRQFRLTNLRLQRLERELGLASFTDLFESKMSATVTNAVLWCALLDPAPTKEQVLGWIDEVEHYEACMQAAVEIVAAAVETFATANPQTGGPAGTGTPPDAPPSASA